ncbi:STAS domain-containing protein [Oceanobacillus salinisoli]|uniref:STAS domain-containing protein n=1 Tax=Oceanobacillus salinisoli TaxID=2678611 RepID=UPI0018CC68D2|nr:STAS domain-containing protein [Oceanobacillus salinisoli]
MTTPVIPLTDSIAILPIVGTMDTYRAKRIQQRALDFVSKTKVNHFVIDLSGVDYMDTFVIKHLGNIISGLKLLGCDAILTGMKVEVVHTMVDLGISLKHVATKRNLKQAFEEYVLENEGFE